MTVWGDIVFRSWLLACACASARASKHKDRLSHGAEIARFVRDRRDASLAYPAAAQFPLFPLPLASRSLVLYRTHVVDALTLRIASSLARSLAASSEYVLCVLYDSDVLSREVVDRVAALLGTNATTRLVGVGLSDLRDRYPRVGMGGHPGATLTPLAKSHYQQLAYAYAYRALKERFRYAWCVEHDVAMTGGAWLEMMRDHDSLDRRDLLAWRVGWLPKIDAVHGGGSWNAGMMQRGSRVQHGIDLRHSDLNSATTEWLDHRSLGVGSAAVKHAGSSEHSRERFRIGSDWKLSLERDLRYSRVSRATKKNANRCLSLRGRYGPGLAGIKSDRTAFLFGAIVRFSERFINLIDDRATASLPSWGHSETAVPTLCNQTAWCSLGNLSSRWVGLVEYQLPIAVTEDVFDALEQLAPNLLFHPVRSGASASSSTDVQTAQRLTTSLDHSHLDSALGGRASRRPVSTQDEFKAMCLMANPRPPRPSFNCPIGCPQHAQRTCPVVNCVWGEHEHARYVHLAAQACVAKCQRSPAGCPFDTSVDRRRVPVDANF